MQRLVRLHHLGHEHGPLAGQRGQGAQGCGQVDAGDSRVDHELQQLIQRCLPFLTKRIYTGAEADGGIVMPILI